MFLFSKWFFASLKLYFMAVNKSELLLNAFENVDYIALQNGCAVQPLCLSTDDIGDTCIRSYAQILLLPRV
jgi:hypothetical protein